GCFVFSSSAGWATSAAKNAPSASAAPGHSARSTSIMVFSAMEAPILPCAAAVVGVAPVSRRPPDIALAATLHDPPGALADAIAEGLPRLAALYRGVAVATSPPTSARVAAILAAHGAHAGATRANLRGPLYRLSLRGALATGAAHVHYLDLDRALRWAARAPRELRAVLRLGARHRVLVLGRTPKAHRS